MKKFIFGFILGALLFSIIPVGAAIEEYILYKSEARLTVDGQEYNNPNLPILNYKGYNYIPAATFRDICKAIGVDFQWIGEVKEIQIKTAANSVVQEPVKEESTVSDKITETPDGITNIDTWEGKQYIGTLYMRNKIREKGYDLIFDIKSEKWCLVKGNDVLISDIPVTMMTGYGYGGVEVNYYINTILPLIK